MKTKIDVTLMRIVERIVEIPESVDVNVSGKKVTISGPKGSLAEDFSHMPIEISMDKQKVVIWASWPKKKEIETVGTAAASFKNMITGVTNGFVYKLKTVHAHFPVTIKVQEGEKKIIIENFIGERNPRISKIIGDVNVKVSGDEITVEGMDIREVSQTASNMETATKIRNKDQRVFLDGIYISEKK